MRALTDRQTPARKPGEPSLGFRVAIAAGLFALAVAVSAVADHFYPAMPQNAVSAWLAAALFGAVVFALAVPWRGAIALALAVALITGGLTYSPPLRAKTATGVAAVGAFVGRHLHKGKGVGG